MHRTAGHTRDQFDRALQTLDLVARRMNIRAVV
jgi:hypothetical protein